MTHPKRVALVTGGGRGIGLGICRELARSGFDLAFCGTKPAAEVAPVVAELEALGAAVLYQPADVAVAAQRGALLDAIRARFGRLDALVNNAGVAPNVRADLLDADEASFERLIRINLQGPYFLTQACARWMIEQKKADPARRPSITSVSSISATVASVNRGDYCISKAGVAMAVQLWAARLGEFGIPVYEVRPGVIRTDMTSGVVAKYDNLIANGLCVEARWGLPEDVGRAVATLARGELSYATGQILMIDGGLTLQRL
jgi:NAD(P)-dependent dehydrogenase (short-subunit alcohol dehydrogenase family)